MIIFCAVYVVRKVWIRAIRGLRCAKLNWIRVMRGQSVDWLHKPRIAPNEVRKAQINRKPLDYSKHAAANVVRKRSCLTDRAPQPSSKILLLSINGDASSSDFVLHEQAEQHESKASTLYLELKTRILR